MIEQTNPSHADNDDEIDLVELFYGLSTQKWLIVLITLVFAVGAASYAFFSKPVYEARVAVLPPSLSDIAGFSLGRTGENTDGNDLKPFLVSDVYAVFSRNLQSEKSLRHFFREVYLPSLSEAQRSGSQDGLYKGRRQKLSATPDLSGTVLPLCLIPNSALKSAPPFKSVMPKTSACVGLPA
ncbi:Wzz/FepE/Etk N-terminal domain-containing protein [Pseudomonas sp. CC6-YY-74]|uniref:Wzz/FepE/Etk N-terminal domain-containing protein n=1 Tax=Pseudomonas sp. CC6-YY-74 TaxID=1930532 RepID=UPI0021156FAF|nr:Wzz/FepE/Etk N-terminal domain-containing protein [Pseudomonas sp. CC6-YY-74]